MAVISGGREARACSISSPFFVRKCLLKYTVYPDLIFLFYLFLISMESFLLFSLDRFGSFKANLERSSVEISVKNNLF